MLLLAHGARAKLYSFCLVACLVVAPAFPSGAAVYYVSDNGSDTNAGTTLALPFRTVRHAARIMVAGDTCWLRGGTYRETLVPLHSGTPAAPITFAAYSNEVVTLSGLDLVSNWTAVGDGSFCAPVSWTLGEGYDQVFVDGTMVHQVRFPEFGGGDLLHPALASVSVDANNPNLVTSPGWGGHVDDFWAGAWFSGGVGERWSWQCARVAHSSGSTLMLEPATRSQPWSTGTGTGFLWGGAGLPLAQNQWRLQTQAGTNALKLRLVAGLSPSTHIVEIKRRLWCINLNGHSYIRVRGLRLRAAAVCLTGNGNVLENCSAKFLSHYLRYTWGYSFYGDNPAGAGIFLQGTNNFVRGCTICDTAGSGVFSSGAHNTIVHNRFFNTDYSGTYACAIRLNGLQDLVALNTASASGRDILQPGGAGHSICLNDLSWPGQLCRDLGIIYVWGVNAQAPNGATTRIAYNWLHDHTVSGGPSPLVYLDNWCRNFVVDHNVCWNNAGDAGIRINAPAAGHQIYNNTLFNCDNVGTHTYTMWPDLNPDPAFWTGDFYSYSAANNLFLGNAPEAQLVDWVHFDFRLKPGAPGLNSGVVVPFYTANVIGIPDQGAYEAGGPVWSPGVAGWW